MASPRRSPRRETRILGLMGTGPFLSHFYLLALPPLFPLIKGDFGLSFTQLGLLVDRIGARTVLITGLLLEATAIGGMGFATSYEILLALALVAGLGHSVFHPADYSVLMATMDHSHMGRAFSIHTFMGSAGSAPAPASLIFLTDLWNWRVALMIASVVGIVTALALVGQMGALKSDRVPSRSPVSRRRKAGEPKPPPVGARVLLTPPVLVLFLFFLATALPSSGIQVFSARR